MHAESMLVLWHKVRATVMSAELLLAVEPGGVTTGAPPRVRVALAGLRWCATEWWSPAG